MATGWNFFGWTSGEDTAFDASSAIAMDSSSAFSFGGGSRTDFQSNITLQNWNNSFHYALDTASSSTDYCSDSHLWPITPTGAQEFDTG
ncbi:MAG: hypothetical protein ACTSR4_03495, partial [Candidatus Hodarchaeales archaeon]